MMRSPVKTNDDNGSRKRSRMEDNVLDIDESSESRKPSDELSSVSNDVLYQVVMNNNKMLDELKTMVSYLIDENAKFKSELDLMRTEHDNAFKELQELKSKQSAPMNVDISTSVKEVQRNRHNINRGSETESFMTEPAVTYASIAKSMPKIVIKPKVNAHGPRDENKTIKQTKIVVPKPMLGRSEAVIGLKPKTMERRMNAFEKSLRVGGLDPTVTVDTLCDYITKNTPLTDKTKFRCTMLVKKDQNMSLLSYVSAKIDASSEDYELLTNMELWPNYVTVREFVRMNKRNQRQTVNDEMQPNKSQRKNDENVETAPVNSTNDTNPNAEPELGFQEDVMEVQN